MKHSSTHPPLPTARLLSLFLILALLCGMLSVSAFAADGTETPAAGTDAPAGVSPLTLTETDGVYTISTLEELQEFASMVSGGETFSGKTVRLTADISGLTTCIGSSSKKFAGTFDGGGHTITAAISGTTYQGLFAYNNGTIRNLAVAGTVAGSMYGGCICGYNNGTIESCVNYAAGTFTGSYVGGFAGFNGKTASITNCINRGTVTTTTSGGFCGGIAGSNSGSITNCYNTGTIGNSTKSFAIVGAGTGTVTNCYFLSGGTDAKATEKTDEEMKSQDFVTLLGSGFHYLAGSYPVLPWQGGTPVTPAHTEHTYGAWSSDGANTHSRVCTYEGCEEKQTEDHTWDEGKVTTEPTKDTPGVRTYTCTACDATKTAEIPATAKQVTVSFYDGETLLETVSVAAGSKLETLPETPTKSGYTFRHWSASPNGTAFDFDQTAVTEDLTLYAVWQDNAAANWDYTVIADGTEIMLTRYKGTASTVITPLTIDGLPVTTIGKETFTGNATITYVWLKDSITTVEDGTGMNGGAFRGCSKLRTVILSDNMTRIADYMFYGIASDISYPIQVNFKNVTEIGDYAFSCCNNIVTLQLPDTVRKIGEGAFYQARRLAVLDIPGVVEIGADAFTETIFEENYENQWKSGTFSGIVYAGKVAYLYMGDDRETGAMVPDTELILEDGTLGISEFLFTNHYTSLASCRVNLTSITVPGSVVYIAPVLLDGFAAVTDGSFTGVDLYGIPGTCAETFAAAHENIRFNPLSASGSYDWSQADYEWYDNADGKTYIIRTVDELRAFSDLLDIGEDDFSGATIRLAADIDLGGLTGRSGYGIAGFAWDLSYAANFAGTFDGDGHTISGVYMNYAQDKVGFFDELAGTAVVRNLTVEGIISGWDYVGGITGSSASGAVIENCNFRGSVTGDCVYGYVGGIVGRAMKTTISGCTVSGSVTCAMAEAYREYQQGYAGGICGWNYGSNILNCTNFASVTGNGFGTGGITGFSQLASVTGSVNQGTVRGFENVGGIAGKITASSGAGLHSGCRNEGAVSGTNKVGGIVGISVGVTIADNGYQTILDCSNTETVTAQNHAGGIAGYLHDSAIELCWNGGSIEARQYSGGIGGYVLGGRILNCYNIGTALASEDYAGGILAFDADAESSLTNCYNAGAVTAAAHNDAISNVYGDAEGSITNCYYLSNARSASGKSAEAFASGEVAYLLGEAYGQKIGTEPLPVFRNDNAVYPYTTCGGTASYTNDSALNGLTAPHSFGAWDTVTSPTCTETGLETHVCTACVTYENREIPAIGHTEVTDSAKAPTCTQTGLTESKHCSVCGEVLTAQETVPATGHTEVSDPAKAPSCTETGLTEGKHCSVCGEVLTTQETVKAAGHSYKDGKCTVCGTADPNYKPASGQTQTGDDAALLPWIALFLLSGMASVLLVQKKKHAE